MLSCPKTDAGSTFAIVDIEVSVGSFVASDSVERESIGYKAQWAAMNVKAESPGSDGNINLKVDVAVNGTSGLPDIAAGSLDSGAFVVLPCSVHPALASCSWI